MPVLQGVDKTDINGNVLSPEQQGAGAVVAGAKVRWADISPSTFLVTQLPNNITTAAAAQTYLNAITDATNDPNRSRMMKLLYQSVGINTVFDDGNWYGFIRVDSFTRNVKIEHDLYISSDPNLSSTPWL
jgi:hypothetical protein